MRYALIDNDRVITNIIDCTEDIAADLGGLYLGNHPYTIGSRYPVEELSGEPVPISTLMSAKIATTKTALVDYLAVHPLLWTDGKHYSVTAEKQSLLNNALAVYQLGVQAGLAPELTWNATGEECAVWTFADLCALALGIAAYVKPLVAHQQALEIAIQAATTAEEVQAVEIDYATVG